MIPPTFVRRSGSRKEIASPNRRHPTIRTRARKRPGHPNATVRVHHRPAPRSACRPLLDPPESMLPKCHPASPGAFAQILGLGPRESEIPITEGTDQRRFGHRAEPGPIPESPLGSLPVVLPPSEGPEVGCVPKPLRADPPDLATTSWPSLYDLRHEARPFGRVINSICLARVSGSGVRSASYTTAGAICTTTRACRAALHSVSPASTSARSRQTFVSRRTLGRRFFCCFMERAPRRSGDCLDYSVASPRPRPVLHTNDLPVNRESSPPLVLRAPAGRRHDRS